MIRHSSPTVTTTAAALFTDAAGVTLKRRLVTVQNRGATAVLIGDSTVSSTVFGFSLGSSATQTFEVAKGDILYAIVGAGTQQVNVTVVDIP